MESNLPGSWESGEAEGARSAGVSVRTPTLRGPQGRREARWWETNRDAHAQRDERQKYEPSARLCLGSGGEMRAVGAARLYYYEERLVAHRRGGGPGGGAARRRRALWTSPLDEAKQRLE